MITPNHITIVPHPTNPAPSKLISCTRCRENLHCASWIVGDEFQRRINEFVTVHKDCKP